MNPRPKLELYVSRGCGACKRAERALRGCARLASLVEVTVLEIGASGVRPPSAVVGGPTTVFEGAVMALGTPDCEELAERLESRMFAGR
jgi:hypothetical protein